MDASYFSSRDNEVFPIFTNGCDGVNFPWVNSDTVLTFILFSVRYMVSPPMFIENQKRREKQKTSMSKPCSPPWHENDLSRQRIFTEKRSHSSPTYRGGGLLANLIYVMQPPLSLLLARRLKTEHRLDERRCLAPWIEDIKQPVDDDPG